MTDADVDGAHIAALLITFFYRVMPETIRQGRVFMALPPLYRISAGPLSEYARDDAHRATTSGHCLQGQEGDRPVQGPGRNDGLPAEGETTMDEEAHPGRITVPDAEASIEDLVERLMGKRAEPVPVHQENAQFVKEELDV